ncbi:MAG: hypothetical protein ACYCZT_10555 [Thiobacillus sp.]
MPQSNTVFGCVGSPTCDDADLFKPRRFSDPVSPLNDKVYDKARLLAQVVEMIDGLGIEIMNVDADRVRNSRVQVAPSRQCDALEGVEFKRQNGYSHWVANRFGVEIVWCIPVQEVA